MQRAVALDRRPSSLSALLLAAACLTLVLAPAGRAARVEAGERLISVLVRSVTGAAGAEDAVREVGGTVTHRLPIIDGVSGRIPAQELTRLQGDSRVWQVSPDERVGFHGTGATETSHRIQKVVNAHKLWSTGVTGRGVNVGLLDTGVAGAGSRPDLPDLAGRVVCGADLTHEANTEAHCEDTFGHGTFMAGLIAGDGTASSGKYKGAAPEARIVSVKAAPYDGSTDVSTIIAGIQWFVMHRDDPNLGVDVLNLSLGSDSSQDYRVSPLNYAVEKAWEADIAVVVSSGNSGPDSRTVMKPGDDPFVITVGASNDEGSVATLDDRVPVFSSRGPTRANDLVKPDVVSPGVHTISLRAAGSAIDDQYGPGGARVGDHYFRGTGTSMSTATVSGVVAQILQRNPSLTPDQVKFRLMETARPIADTDPNAAGKGLVDAYSAATSPLLGSANAGVTPSTGLGSLALDRGSLDVEVSNGTLQIALTGEFQAKTNPEDIDVTNPLGLVPYVSGDVVTQFNGTSWKDEDWAGTSWKGTSWKATVWDGTSWKGTSWKNADWEGTSWKGVDWDGTSWKGTSWKSYWYAAAWD